jgi:FAD:protein FMN transferase
VHGILGLAVLALLVTLPASALQRFEAVEAHMGTLVRVTIYVADEAAAARAFRVAFDRIRELDVILSDYNPDSELNRTSRDGVGRPVTVSADLFTVLAASQDLARATGGAFDITLGPVVRLWREARAAGRLPEARALEEAARRTGYTKLVLDAGRRTVMLCEAGMSLDSGGIGKGYAAGEAVAALRAHGVASALVAVSGDLALGDAPPGRAGWRVRIDVGGADLPDTLELSNAAVSTSGSAAQHLAIDGRRYSHIVEPASARGLEQDMTVVVVAPQGIDADGLATAVSVLGVERGLDLVESRAHAAALVVDRTGADTTVRTSSRFPPLQLRLPSSSHAPGPTP